VCVAWIVVCVGALLFYKYSHFLLESLLAYLSPEAARSTGVFADKGLPAAPPLAISFFAFESVHYLIEVHRGRRPTRSPHTFALFAIFWPSLVAGLVKRYRQFVASAGRGMWAVELDNVRYGLTRVAIGVVKKFMADHLTVWIGSVHQNFVVLASEHRWLVSAAIGFRIPLYCSGYSDMAIGFARMMGIRLPENSRWPYLAASVGDFWHRSP
jgi:alginate O-acetyltransferase complex protein AlgI